MSTAAGRILSMPNPMNQQPEIQTGPAHTLVAAVIKRAILDACGEFETAAVAREGESLRLDANHWLRCAEAADWMHGLGLKREDVLLYVLGHSE